MGGLLNGFLIARIKLPALVATLGTYAFFRGIAYVLLGDQAGRGYPDAFTYLGQGMISWNTDPIFRGSICCASGDIWFGIAPNHIWAIFICNRKQ